MNEKLFHKIAKECANLVTKKNKAYGNSFERAGEILKILFPDGVGVDQYQDMLTITRVLDKLFRICSGDKKAFEENPWRDVLGYSLLSVCSEEANEEFELSKEDYRFKSGDKVTLVNDQNTSAKFGATGSVCGNKNNLVLIEWDKKNINWNGQIDGAYEDYLFDLVEK